MANACCTTTTRFVNTAGVVVPEFHGVETFRRYSDVITGTLPAGNFQNIGSVSLTPGMTWPTSKQLDARVAFTYLSRLKIQPLSPTPPAHSYGKLTLSCGLDRIVNGVPVGSSNPIFLGTVYPNESVIQAGQEMLDTNQGAWTYESSFFPAGVSPGDTLDFDLQVEADIDGVFVGADYEFSLELVFTFLPTGDLP